MVSAVSAMNEYDCAIVSVTVTSHVTHLSSFLGISVTISGHCYYYYYYYEVRNSYTQNTDRQTNRETENEYKLTHQQ